MEEWLEAGALSDEEFAQLVRLTARYVYWDVDQFDHWLLASEDGEHYIDFTEGDPPPFEATAYRPMWPRVDAGTSPKWTVWSEDDDGNRVEVAQFGNEGAAHALATSFERRGQAQRQGQGQGPRYSVEAL